MVPPPSRGLFERVAKEGIGVVNNALKLQFPFYLPNGCLIKKVLRALKLLSESEFTELENCKILL